MLYLDASVVVALFTPDEHTERVLRWMGEKRGALLCVSRWVDVEFAATLAAKMRAGALSDATAREARGFYAKASRETFTRLEIGDQHFSEGVRLAQANVPGLRGADALHLGIVSIYRATLCTLDSRQADAGEALGVAVERLLVG
jgi:predicted nucleic acid-binding protein